MHGMIKFTSCLEFRITTSSTAVPKPFIAMQTITKVEHSFISVTLNHNWRVNLHSIAGSILPANMTAIDDTFLVHSL